MPTDIPQSTDIVFVDTLRVEADIGADCWGKERAQPVEITVHLHLNPDYLEAAGSSDNVVDSVHYGHLTKTISSLIKSRTESNTPFNGVDDLIREVARRAVDLGKEAVDEVRVVVELPKLILLARAFSVDVVVARKSPEVFVSKKVLVKDIVVPVIIGVNPPEREAKQRVLVNVLFYENDGPLSGPLPDYPEVVKALVTEMEATSYLTLEKFVMDIVRSACTRSSNNVTAVTARAQKPSALSFAQYSGVEITRKRQAFISS